MRQYHRRMSFAFTLIGLIAIGIANPIIGVVIAGGLWAIWRTS